MRSSKKIMLVLLMLVLTVGLSACEADTGDTNTKTAQVEKNTKYWVKNGNLYTINVDYVSPGGEESNRFTLRLDNGVISDVSVEINTNIDASIVLQKQFAAELKKLIIGKKIAEIENLDVVSGASLTTDAFNKAMKALKIKVAKG